MGIDAILIIGSNISSTIKELLLKRLQCKNGVFYGIG